MSAAMNNYVEVSGGTGVDGHPYLVRDVEMGGNGKHSLSELPFAPLTFQTPNHEDGEHEIMEQGRES
jgi:hypothetical protein